MRKIIILFPLFFLLGCISMKSEIQPSQFDREFFQLTTAERKNQFNRYDMETQYELLIIGNQLVHPPALYLSMEFAKHGQKAIPFLRNKLISSKYDVTVYDLVVIFSEMQRIGSYNVKTDTSLIELIEYRISLMDGLIKELTQKKLDEIQQANTS
jgi:hypothetical protein